MGKKLRIVLDFSEEEKVQLMEAAKGWGCSPQDFVRSMALMGSGSKPSMIQTRHPTEGCPWEKLKVLVEGGLAVSPDALTTRCQCTHPVFFHKESKRWGNKGPVFRIVCTAKGCRCCWYERPTTPEEFVTRGKAKLDSPLPMSAEEAQKYFDKMVGECPGIWDNKVNVCKCPRCEGVRKQLQDEEAGAPKKTIKGNEPRGKVVYVDSPEQLRKELAPKDTVIIQAGIYYERICKTCNHEASWHEGSFRDPDGRGGKCCYPSGVEKTCLCPELEPSTEVGKCSCGRLVGLNQVCCCKGKEIGPGGSVQRAIGLQQELEKMEMGRCICAHLPGEHSNFGAGPCKGLGCRCQKFWRAGNEAAEVTDKVPTCVCGHWSSQHDDSEGKAGRCFVMVGAHSRCICKEFEERKTPVAVEEKRVLSETEIREGVKLCTCDHPDYEHLYQEGKGPGYCCHRMMGEDEVLGTCPCHKFVDKEKCRDNRQVCALKGCNDTHVGESILCLTHRTQFEKDGTLHLWDDVSYPGVCLAPKCKALRMGGSFHCKEHLTDQEKRDFEFDRVGP